MAVHREVERFVWDPDALSDPWSRGFSHRVERTRAGRPFAWARARSSRFYLETLTPGERTLVLDGFPIRVPDGPQTVEVELGGRSVAKLEWTQPARQEVPLPAGALVPGRNELTLRYGHLLRPVDLGISETDTRELAMAWHEIALVPVQGAPAQPDASMAPTSGSRGDMEIRQNVEPQGAGATRQDGSTIWWRWTPTAPESRIVVEGTSLASETHLAVVLDDGSRTWTSLHEERLTSGQDFAVDLPLSAAPGSVARLGVVVYHGRVRYQRLRTSCRAPDGFRPRPVVLVTLDTSRRDAFGMYDADARGQSPVLDALGARGVVFEQAYSPTPATAPTHATLLLSRDPHEHGLRINGHPLPPITGDHLAAQLKAWGYRTAAFVSLAVLAGDTGFAQGFDHFDDHFDQGWWRFAAEVNERALPWIAQRPVRTKEPPWFLWLHYPDPHAPYGVVDEPGRGAIVELDGAEMGILPTSGLRQTRDLELTPGRHVLRLRAPRAPTPAGAPDEDEHLYICRAVHVRGERVSRDFGSGWEWVRSFRRMGALAEIFLDIEALQREDTAARPVRLEITLEDVPTPREARRRYAEEVSAMDRAVDALLRELERSGWMEDGVLLFAADHGEDLGEHDGHFGHTEHIGPTLSRVPMLLYDAHRPAPARVGTPVSILDVAPTLSARLGLDPAPAWRGVDALRAPGDRPLYLETFPPAKRHWRGVVRGRLLLQGIVPQAVDSAKTAATLDSIPPPQLFDVVADPERTIDLAARLHTESADSVTQDEGRVTAEELAAMSALWLRWIDSGPGADSAAATDPRMLERLRALGYVQ